MKLSIFSITSLATSASASWTKNLNYRSPSEHHPGLGISLHKVNKRSTPSKFDPSQLNFTHGVASGDPYADSVILWTRLAPLSAETDSNRTANGTIPLYSHGANLTVSTAPVCADYWVSETEDLKNPVSKGRAYTSSDIDYTVKVEASGLAPFTRYYYGFSVCDSDKTSSVGRTKTAPATDDHVSNVGLAVYSCANYPFGFFNAYGNPARKDSVDYVIHLGDYIYEYAGDGDYGYGQSIDRVPKPESIIYTLKDYRERHATYRSDLDLQFSHGNFPWIPVWDDHEVGLLFPRSIY